MTIAALHDNSSFTLMVDKNPKAKNIYAPKSHLPVFGIEELEKNRVDKILVFSFGYFNEVVEELTRKYKYTPGQFTSILDLLELNHA